MGSKGHCLLLIGQRSSSQLKCKCGANSSLTSEGRSHSRALQRSRSWEGTVTQEGPQKQGLQVEVEGCDPQRGGLSQPWLPGACRAKGLAQGLLGLPWFPG